ncbi:MAG: disulfide bond formation protein B [bacterium]|nr:disulfide bond formation protein B [bacterium]
MTLVQLVNQVASVSTIIGQVIVVLAVVFLVINKKNRLLSLIKERAVLFSFIVALLAVLGSLFYSEVAKFEPCKLCWIQRIFIYPQAVLLGIALCIKDRNAGIYSIALSAVGGFFALYHYLLQFGLVPTFSCSIAESAVSCSQRYVTGFGYITFPLMSLTAFSLIIVFMVVQKRYNKE